MQLYAQLLKQGWRMKDIDECDLIGYLQVMMYDAAKGRKAAGTIDELPFFGVGAM